LFELAEIPNGRAHRFRDTFAVELLLSGVPRERVSVLLGHSSIRVTERHYAPWVRSRQEQLEADLQTACSQDPVALMALAEPEKGYKKGTRENRASQLIHFQSVRLVGAVGENCILFHKS